MTDLDRRPRPIDRREILVVEDDASDLRLIQEAFKETGSDISLQSVAESDDVLDRLRAVQAAEPTLLPDLVLLDHRVLGRNGTDAIHAIRTDPGLQCLPIVVLGRSEDPDDVKRWYEAGANAYLVKPAEFDGLVSLVETLEAFWFDLATPPALDPADPPQARLGD